MATVLKRTFKLSGIVFHCWGGYGRSSLGAIALMIQSGMSAKEGMAIATEKRGYRVPRTDEQIEFLIQLEKQMKN